MKQNETLKLLSHSSRDKLCFLAVQDQKLESLKADFEKEQAELMKEFDTERESLIEQHAQEMTDLQDIRFAMDQNYNDRENDAKSEFQSMRDEIKNKVYHFN